MTKRIFLAFALSAFWSISLFAQQDAEGTKDNPMFPTRMPNYYITEVTENYNAVDFNMVKGGERIESKEGNTSVVRYDFYPESAKSKPSVLQILRNYENAAKKIGGVTVFLDAAEAIATFKIMKEGKVNAWVKVVTGGDLDNDFIVLTILHLEAMKQDVTSDDLFKTLSDEGRITLYINFETGKAVIQPESQAILDQVAAMLSGNPDLKVRAEGHTDNVGAAPANQTLSETRAAAVMNAIIGKGVDKARITSKGYGQTKPISDNQTEDGRAANRRVEIVKIG